MAILAQPHTVLKSGNLGGRERGGTRTASIASQTAAAHLQNFKDCQNLLGAQQNGLCDATTNICKEMCNASPLSPL